MSAPHEPARAPLRRPLLGLRTTVLFPHDVATVEVLEPWNLRALARVNALDPLCVAVPLRDGAPDELAPEHFLPIGTLARAVSRTALPGGGLRVVLQGLRRVRLEELDGRDGCMHATCCRVQSAASADPEAARRAGAELRAKLEALAREDPSAPRDLAGMVALYGEDLERITDLAATVLPLDCGDRARLLLEGDPAARLQALDRLLETLLLRARAGTAVEQRVAERIQRRYLREKYEVLKTELGEPSARDLEHERFVERIESVALTSAARAAALRELEHLRGASAASAAAARIRAYLEWLLELPWPAPLERRADPYDFERVEALLSRGHHGLTEVKRRIGEFLAVRRLGGSARGTVLCFHGPPGTGKSSMGRAVAHALGRPFLSLPIGAITHEREIVGISHDRPGGAPGMILAGLHRTGAHDPVILLHEIDKVRLGGEGTSAGALLQLLDADQNSEFLDLYLRVPYDLSSCLLLATANDSEAIPEALLDRMEVIEFPGYSEAEKYAIARAHLLPRAREYAGVRARQLQVTPAALRAIIRGYTEEAGVRSLQRHLATLARQAAVQTVRGAEPVRVRKKDLVTRLGPRTVDEDLRARRPAVGVTTGLAWTSAGGSLLPIEALSMPGSGRLTLTGQLGDVLRESVQTAVSYVRTFAAHFELDPEVLDNVDLHLHFPSAATPKDGPSAGVAIATALVSLLTKRPARHDVAMTGEMSLLGQVLAVGGVREKLLAAIRAGVAEVILPKRNGEDSMRLDADIRGRLRIHLIDDVREAFQIALLGRAESARLWISLRGPRRRAAREARDVS